ncbi:gephyrin-like molybdotransferase receptor GlpR [Streptomyces sp. NPDC048111]|uniref:divisome protein SepX/GlpR n=1 Tax=Streptomyces sp. NPDC048111 TaxID=3365500 RepID=UPI003711B8DA
MSSSGLIYAVIVGAWAAYLVPMWLRRQDELNEARPTERFSTAIRLLSGRSAMERRYAKELRQRAADESAEPAPVTPPDAPTEPLAASAEPADARDFGVPAARAPRSARPAQAERAERRRPGSAASAERARRAQRSAVLARRRRTTVVLFLAFTLGAVVAAVGGLGFLWAPAVPAALLSAYIVHLRRQEKRRFAFTMDRRRAEAAAQRLRESRPRARATAPGAEPDDETDAHHPAPVPEPAPAPALSPQEAGRRALVEQTDHQEWVDQQRERGPGHGASWDPVPVPLPTYVTAPVAPRATGGIDLGAPDTWSSARSSTADPAPAPPAADPPPRQRPGPSRHRTPLFDQYEDEDRPRAANE